ncbi:MAG TPA: hypothetical protein ENH40_00425 [Nitrospirae bacterium]|nr:hypothetical protein [Nitrospirota bacterium]
MAVYDRALTSGEISNHFVNGKYFGFPINFGLSGDGVGDVCDVCPTIYDPDQTDSDGDAKGDWCDWD